MKNMIEHQDVQRVMLSWAIRFKSAGYTMEDLRLLSREYFSELSTLNMTRQRFENVVKRVNMSVKFFPTMKDIIDADNEIQKSAATESRIRQIELNHPVGESYDKGLQAIEKIKAMLAGKMSMSEAIGDNNDR